MWVVLGVSEGARLVQVVAGGDEVSAASHATWDSPPLVYQVVGDGLILQTYDRYELVKGSNRI